MLDAETLEKADANFTRIREAVDGFDGIAPHEARGIARHHVQQQSLIGFG